jgi:hypothetical protein
MFFKPHWLLDGNLAVLAGSTNGALPASELSRITIQTSTNLIQWEPLTFPPTFTNGSILLIDQAASNYPARFYRIIEQ